MKGGDSKVVRPNVKAVRRDYKGEVKREGVTRVRGKKRVKGVKSARDGGDNKGGTYYCGQKFLYTP